MPRRVLAAFLASGRSAPSLFDKATDYDALMAMSVRELREKLVVPEAGLAREPRNLHAYAPVTMGNPEGVPQTPPGVA